MSDWIGLGVIFLFLALVVFSLSHLGKPYDADVEEFERRAQEGTGLMAAGISGLQKLLDPNAAKAAEVIQDLRQGHLDGEQDSGQGDDTPDRESDSTSLESDRSDV